MTKIRSYVRPAPALGALALLATVSLHQACGGSNEGMTGNAGTTGSSTGNAGTTGSAGTTGTAGTTGSAGTTGTGGTGTFGQPACLSTVEKGAACGPSDQQMCYKTCGPERSGVKLETCTTAGIYSEMSGCDFDEAKDYSCYKIPATANAACPAGLVPQGSVDCDVPTCTACNSLQGVVGGTYKDSQGAEKPGWCVCQVANTAGRRTWSCATDTSWPCPMQAGCGNN